MSDDENDISELFEKCKDLSEKDPSFILKLTLCRVSVDDIKAIIERMNKVVINIGDGLTLLHLAAQFGHTEAVAYLALEQHHPTEVRTMYGETPLDQAVWRGQLTCCMILIKAGADVDCVTKSGYSLLHRCAFYNHPRLAALLCLAGANMKIKDNEGKTAYEVAVEQGNEQVAKTLKPLFTENGDDITGIMYETNNPKHPNHRPEARQAFFNMFVMEMEAAAEGDDNYDEGGGGGEDEGEGQEEDEGQEEGGEDNEEDQNKGEGEGKVEKEG